MNEVKRRLLLGVSKVLNLGLMILSFIVSTVPLISVSSGIAPAALLSMRLKLSNFVIFSLMLCVWHIILSSCGLYQSKRLATLYTLVVDAGKATTLGTIGLMVVVKLFGITMVTLSSLVLFWILSSISIIVTRVLVRYLLKAIRRRGLNLRYVLILGTNSRALSFARRIQAEPELGYRVLGFVDEDWQGRRVFLQTGGLLCCDFEGFAEYLRRNVVDEVAVYLPLRSFYEQTSKMVALCEQHGITIRFDSDIFNGKVARPHADDFHGDRHITVYSGSLHGWPIFAKRVLDFTVSFLLIVLMAPLFALVALLIKITSDGPVFFAQERVGHNKRRFVIYKFRTMVPHAEQMLPELEVLNEIAGPVFKIRSDPRMTHFGRLLRRASIDELPQLFNVLKGDMSLVGPRPLPVRDYEGFSDDWQRRRFSVRPGITCLWQVKGRNSIPFERWMELDIKYLDEWSLWLDFKILALTIPAVLRGSGAA